MKLNWTHRRILAGQQLLSPTPTLEEPPTFVTRHCQQTAPHVFTSAANPDSLQGTHVFGGGSILLFGDFWLTTTSHGSASLHHRHAQTSLIRDELSTFSLTRLSPLSRSCIKLVMTQSKCISDILFHLRNAQVAIEDWNYLMKQTPTDVPVITPFTNALRLHPTVGAVVQHNVATQPQVSLLPSSKLFTLEPILTKFHLMM